MANFSIDEVRACCGNVLPLQLYECISTPEILSKLTYKVNELIATNNSLPDFIEQMIIQYLTAGPLGDLFGDILRKYILTVKNPPNKVAPAVGDGTADDTAAFQECLNYASTNNLTVYVPSGKYLVSSLTIGNNSSIVGAGDNTTELVLKSGENSALLTAIANNIKIAGIKFNGNSGNQVNNLDCVSISSNSAKISYCSFENGYDCLLVEKTGGVILLDNLNFISAVEHFLHVGGLSGVINCNNIIFGNLSVNNGISGIITDSNDDVYNNIIGESLLHTGIEVHGNNNTFSGKFKATRPVIDDGINNSYKFYSYSLDMNYSESAKVSSKDIIINPVNPLTYKTPLDLKYGLKYVPLKDEKGLEYKVLVDGEFIPYDYINVDDFGAYGDGLHDDSGAINSAIAEARSTKIMYIVFPRIYRIDKPINLTDLGPNGITLCGYHVSQASDVSSQILGNTGDVMFDCTGSGKVVFKNLNIASRSRITLNTPSTIGLLFGRSTNFPVVADCKVINCFIDMVETTGSVGIYNNASEIFVIDNSTVKGDYSCVFTKNNTLNITSKFTTTATATTSNTMTVIRMSGIFTGYGTCSCFFETSADVNIKGLIDIYNKHSQTPTAYFIIKGSCQNFSLDPVHCEAGSCPGIRIEDNSELNNSIINGVFANLKNNFIEMSNSSNFRFNTITAISSGATSYINYQGNNQYAIYGNTCHNSSTPVKASGVSLGGNIFFNSVANQVANDFGMNINILGRACASGTFTMPLTSSGGPITNVTWSKRNLIGSDFSANVNGYYLVGIGAAPNVDGEMDITVIGKRDRFNVKAYTAFYKTYLVYSNSLKININILSATITNLTGGVIEILQLW